MINRFLLHAIFTQFKNACKNVISYCYIKHIKTISLFNYSKVDQIDSNLYVVTYIIEGVVYKMSVIPKKGPNLILDVFDENDTNISKTVFPFLKHLQNKTTHLKPAFFNKNKIIIRTLEKDICFSDSQNIFI